MLGCKELTKWQPHKIIFTNNINKQTRKKRKYEKKKQTKKEKIDIRTENPAFSKSKEQSFIVQPQTCTETGSIVDIWSLSVWT